MELIPLLQRKQKHFSTCVFCKPLAPLFPKLQSRREQRGELKHRARPLSPDGLEPTTFVWRRCWRMTEPLKLLLSLFYLINLRFRRTNLPKNHHRSQLSHSGHPDIGRHSAWTEPERRKHEVTSWDCHGVKQAWPDIYFLFVCDRCRICDVLFVKSTRQRNPSQS